MTVKGLEAVGKRSEMAGLRIPVPSAVESAYSIRGSVESLAEALSSFLAVFEGVLPKLLPKPAWALQSSSATSSASWST